MELSKILSIGGKPGLYKHIAQSKTGIVIESITDGKRTSAFASEQISSLNDISIFTNDEDVKLEDVFKNIYEKEGGKKAINPKKASSEEIKAYFESVLPDYDKDRVYVSDMKKVLKWYNLLVENNILEFNKEDDKVEEKEESKDEK
ncbi:MAG: hypothetical protein GXO49_00960 [Chlorobi bacterium]|nr:hypothetical protein [Chlorobiota bacterium]